MLGKDKKIYDAIVIGGGPAGITAALYLARRKLCVLMLYDRLGGQASKTAEIENYVGFRMISGQDFTNKLKEHLRSYDLVCKEEKVSIFKKQGNLFNISTEKGNYNTKSVVIATGAKQKMLNIKGEKEFLNKGVAYCATCDAPFFRNKDVAIIGGGNSALEAAIQLEKYAKKIYLITINNEIKGEKVLIDKVKKFRNLKIVNCTKITEIKGDNFVKSIIVFQNKIKKQLKVQGVFIEIGYISASELFNVKKNKWGEIIIGRKNETSVSGIYAAGDVTNVPVKQIIVAAGEGAKAAIGASEYLARLKGK